MTHDSSDKMVRIKVPLVVNKLTVRADNLNKYYLIFGSELVDLARGSGTSRIDSQAEETGGKIGIVDNIKFRMELKPEGSHSR